MKLLLLQSNMTDLPTGVILIAIIVFILGVLITRWIFSISQITAQLKAQTKVLLLIADNQKVERKKLKLIINTLATEGRINSNLLDETQYSDKDQWKKESFELGNTIDNTFT